MSTGLVILQFSDDDSDEESCAHCLLDAIVNITVEIEKYVDSCIKKKLKMPDDIRDSLVSHIANSSLTYHCFDEGDELKYEYGLVLNDLKDILFKLDRYAFKPTRMNAQKEAKIDAYSDPEVAAYVEMTKGGLKTRNRFYKR